MKTAEQPQHLGEQFDRYLRTYNDATTWLAETLDGSMRTPFEYRFDGHELYADDGSSVGDIFEASLKDGARLAATRPDLAFELRRRKLEWEEYGLMLGMARGELPNTMAVVSDFPPELMDAATDVGGYNVTRKQTMLRVLAWRDGCLHMHTQSLDGSDRTALEAVYAWFGQAAQPGELLGQRLHAQLPDDEQDYLADRLTGVYDRALGQQYGGQWYAGRQEAPHDTYQFVLGEHQLVDRFVTAELRGGISADDKYNIAALLAKRFEWFKRPDIVVTEQEIIFGGIVRNLEWELRVAGDEARAEGRVFSGCGASADGESADSNASRQLAEAGYGNKAETDEDQYGSLIFKCPKGHTNRRPRGKLIDVCKTCRASVRC